MRGYRPTADLLWMLLWVAFSSGAWAAEPAPTVELWSGAAPGDQGPLAGPEQDLTKPSDHQVAGKRVVRLGNVARPTISVHRPPAEKDTGAAVLICPGGAYHILALDLEGTEVCDWLNSIGVTGVLLKYRVPRRPERPMHAAPLQDAQRAMGLVRERAKDWGIDPARIGVLGFSAGGHLAAALSNNHSRRSYPEVDEADKLSCRPDFAVLVYPAYLVEKGQPHKLVAEMPVSASTPPTFLVMAQDDPVGVESPLGYSASLHAAKVPFELHIYPKGGHGYGLRRTELAITSWPDRAAAWLRASGFLETGDKKQRP